MVRRYNFVSVTRRSIRVPRIRGIDTPRQRGRKTVTVRAYELYRWCLQEMDG